MSPPAHAPSKLTRDVAVELLERALAYARRTWVDVRPEHLRRPTPCAAWDLDGLLVHLDDALDAFTESASGSVPLDPSTALEARVGTLQLKAGNLLAAWSTSDLPTQVHVGGVAAPTPLVVLTAALEIAVHGWDVAQSTGRRTPMPEPLARALWPVARVLVGDDDRRSRFAAPLDGAMDRRDGDGDRLVAFLGRRPLAHRTGPPARVSPVRCTEHRSAS